PGCATSRIPSRRSPGRTTCATLSAIGIDRTCARMRARPEPTCMRPSSAASADGIAAAMPARMNETTTDPRFGGSHALVIGGSMAALPTARVLADHFERVTLVERDPLPDDAEPRKGVPQGRHLHGLLQRGQEILEGLFPGLVDTLISGGAVPCDF